MRVKFVESEDLEVVESTANMLLMEGWERDSTLQLFPNGKYFMSFVKFTSSARGYSNSPVGRLHPEGDAPQPTICMPETGRS